MKRVISESLFSLGDGTSTKLVRYDEGISVLRASDDTCTITVNGAMPYIQAAYEHILSKHALQNKNLYILHLGTGFGYDLLFVSHLLKNKNIEDCKMTGVDFTDYGRLRVDTKRFCHPIKFCVADALDFVQSSTYDAHRFTILFVDLHTHPAIPSEIVYDTNFWQHICEKINPNIIIVNIGLYQNTTCQILTQVFGDITYTKLKEGLEIYERKTDENR